ncbi:MAG: hypothetical protein JW893_04945 [Candidatus Omnitrophica bacterium]|nr:hypothetical protein [Candidatus Omnitrophota bacterium]
MKSVLIFFVTVAVIFSFGPKMALAEECQHPVEGVEGLGGDFRGVDQVPTKPFVKPLRADAQEDFGDDINSQMMPGYSTPLEKPLKPKAEKNQNQPKEKSEEGPQDLPESGAAEIVLRSLSDEMPLSYENVRKELEKKSQREYQPKGVMVTELPAFPPPQFAPLVFRNESEAMDAAFYALGLLLNVPYEYEFTFGPPIEPPRLRLDPNRGGAPEVDSVIEDGSLDVGLHAVMVATGMPVDDMNEHGVDSVLDELQPFEPVF